MKHVLAVLAITLFIGACKDRQTAAGTESSVIVPADTTGMAQFKAWKAEQEKQALIDSVKKSEAAKHAVARKSNSSSTKKETISYESSNAAEEKKGWSKKAKGAVIGAGTGAAAGAVINKKDRVLGGVVGGVVGGAAGYGIGRHKDKKDGRQQ
jgi:hypothetical protein